jgi:phage terminase small subunit
VATENDKPALTPKQQRFCEEYILDLNATKAAIRAGYSSETARSIGSENLSKPDIEAEIERLLEKRSGKLAIKAEDVLRETYLMAMSDIGEAFDEEGKLKPIHEIPMHLRRMISSVEVDELWEPKEDGKGKEQVGFTRKIKFWSKEKALHLLGQHLNLFIERHDVTGKVTLEQLVASTGSTGSTGAKS